MSQVMVHRNLKTKTEIFLSLKSTPRPLICFSVRILAVTSHPSLDGAVLPRRVFGAEVLVPQHTANHAAQRDDELDHQPRDYIYCLRSLEQFASVLDTNQGFCHHYAHIYPTLGTDPFARRVRNEYEVLPHRRGHDYPYQSQTYGHQWVRGGQLEHVLEEKRIQLGRLPKENQLTESQDPHVRALRIEPAYRRETFGRKLKHRPFDLARGRVYVFDADPLVFPHLQNLADLQATPDAQTVTDQHVQDERVPPTLDEVRQQMGEEDFSDLPHNAYRPQYTHVPNQYRLEEPAEEVAEREYVYVRPKAFHRYIRTVDAVLLVHIDVKVPQLRIEPIQYLFDRLVVLEQNEKTSEQIEHAHPEDDPPDGRMRTCEWSIRERQYRDDEEEERAAHNSRPDVVLDIVCVPEMEQGL